MRLSLWLATVLAAGCGNGSPQWAAAPSKSSMPEFRALVYSNGLASRFQLAAADAVALGTGVLGIAVHVTRESDSNAACLLYLYLDNSLPVAYPPRSTGRIHDLNPETGPLFFAGKLNESDVSARAKRVFEMPILYRSRAYGQNQQRGVTDGGPAWAFYRDLLPGLNVIVYSVACRALDPSHGAADIWILREGHGNETLNPEAPSADAALGIAVPETLLRVSAEATKRASQMPVTLEDPRPPPYSVP